MMWSYYGSKTSLVDYYPAPKEKMIIEPFAGAAKYALKYFDREVLLVDKYEVIVKIWKWLQNCSASVFFGNFTGISASSRLEFACGSDYICNQDALLSSYIKPLDIYDKIEFGK